MIRVADYFAAALVERGVTEVFLLSGGGMMHLQDGLAREPRLRKVFHHHEQAAGIAAEGYARARGGLGVSYGTSGPGATNLVTAVAGAWLDSSPVLFLTGQSKVSQTIQGSGLKDLRQFGTFEINILEVMRPLTKFAWFLDRPEDAPYIFQKAIDIALTGRPGPVFIDVPVDVQGALIDPPACRTYTPVRDLQVPDPAVLAGILARWRAAQRPVIFAGHGVRVAGVAAKLAELAERTCTPVVTTQLGKDSLPFHSPWFAGHPGVKGDRTGNFVIQAADFILCLGTSLHVLSTGYELDQFAPQAYKVQVDVDRANFDRENVNVGVKLLAGLDAFLDAALAWAPVPRATHQAWRAWILALKERFEVYREPHKAEPGRLNMYQALEILQGATRGGEVLVTDAGAAFVTVGQAWQVQEGQRILISGGFGSMGWALPAATGAALARPGEVVLCITGDGSLQTNVHELGVIKENQLNIKIVILNNSGYLSIKNTQDSYFQGQRSGVDGNTGVFLPAVQDLAATYRLPYHTASEPSALASLWARLLTEQGPCLLEIQCNIAQEIIPTVSSRKLPDGRMVSQPLHHMAPFLPEAELDRIMAAGRGDS